MLTGVEIAGLVLGSLPIVVAFLEDYASGLNTIKSLSNVEYRRTIRYYAAELGGQKARLIDTLGVILEGIVYGVDGETSIQQGQTVLEMPIVKQRLQARLRHRYAAFIAAKVSLDESLQELIKRLPENYDQISRSSINFRFKIRKFCNVISKDVLVNLLERANSLTSMLEILVENTQKEESRSKPRRLRGALHQYQHTRKYARTLYRALSHERCWQCAKNQQHMHLLGIGLGQTESKGLQLPTKSDSKFALTLWSREPNLESSSQNPWLGHEFLIETIHIPEGRNRLPPRDISKPTMPRVAKDQMEEQVTNFAVLGPLQAIPWASLSSDPAATDVIDICCSIPAQLSSTAQKAVQKCQGILRDNESSSDHYYELYYSRRLENPTASLHELIESTAPIPRWEAPVDSLQLRRNRLRIACVLATSTVHFQGSWLSSIWRSDDIKIMDDEVDPIRNKLLYMTHNVPLCQTPLQPPKKSLIQSMILFPLGLCLVELAFCQSLEVLKKDEDLDSDPIYTQFKTASRLLDQIYIECGMRYGNAVRECLFWSGCRSEDMDDEAFQSAVFEKIVEPLLEDLSFQEADCFS